MGRLTKSQIVTIVYGIIIDILDYFGLTVPFLGDIFDIIAVMLITKFFGSYAWLSAGIQSIECLPALDVFPFTIIAVLIAMFKARKQSQQVRRLKKI